jgi:PTS system glucitol/sorbitol-specific IIA component
MKYDVTVTGLGPMALEFLNPEMEMQFVILFNEDAPPELAELAILHTPGELKEAPAPGDTMRIGEKTYAITAVGDEAIETLTTLGHCTLAFKGDTEPYRPGCLMLDGEIVTAEDLVDGTSIQIF